MKVTEKPPEIKDELNEGDPSDSLLNSLLNEMDEDKYKVQVGINGVRWNERIRQTKISADPC